MYTSTFSLFDIIQSFLKNLHNVNSEIIQQEHLFIVTELLRANLYEFQKYNQESGDEVYFSLPRIQVCVLWLNNPVQLLCGTINNSVISDRQNSYN
jgi:hypothetical protein